MSKKKYKGNIGFVLDKDLKISRDPYKGHYVYIREDNNDKLKVNIITSLEDKNYVLNDSKLRKVKKGLLYPIPIQDINLPRWSAFNLSSITISKNKLKDLGKKQVKRKHKFFVGKYSK